MHSVSGCDPPSSAPPWRNLLAYLVALHLLHLGSGRAQVMVVAPSVHVTAVVGQDVVLRCQLSPCKDAWSSDIRWIQQGSSGFVHHYQNGVDLGQMEEYKGRTELLRDGLSDGNLDLRITALSSSDSGSYSCAVQDEDGYGEAAVTLEVSDPFSQIIHPWKVAVAVVSTLLVVSLVIIAFLFIKRVAQSRELSECFQPFHQQFPLMELMEDWRVLGSCMAQAEEMDKQAEEIEEQAEETEIKDAELNKQAEEIVKVTLNSRTANPLLVISEDLRSVRWERSWQHLPNLQERFDTMCCVLGQQGFQEGRHCWEVEVMRQQGTYSWCALGVARASVKRKGETVVSPEEGTWALQYDEGKLKALTAPPTLLTLSPVPTRIWVCLDYALGWVTFINAFNGTEIYTFKLALLNGEKVHPWFWLGTNAKLCLRDSSL
ncbi:hypothetical protein ASZ78_002614 [Callipepla squamata]|uniref:Ig-like domain-containing protein n=1 Tax=Callipepla squamata TaxID=9009 RepID=A0A226MCK7_CALSU|nr:hypothetical protein ASZ78_002614 [Callipepla squamata]